MSSLKSLQLIIVNFVHTICSTFEVWTNTIKKRQLLMTLKQHLLQTTCYYNVSFFDALHYSITHILLLLLFFLSLERLVFLSRPICTNWQDGSVCCCNVLYGCYRHIIISFIQIKYLKLLIMPQWMHWGPFFKQFQ
jgi:hypothetical protein